MTRNRMRHLLTFGLVGLLPGCLPTTFQQERVQTDPTVAGRLELPPRGLSPYRTLPDPPPVPIEQEEPRSRVAQKVAPAEPAVEPLPTEPPVPVAPVLPPDPALVAAVRAYLEGDKEAARRHLGNSRSAVTLGTQEELLALLARLQESDLEQLPSEEAGALLPRVERLARAVQARAPLLLDQFCFCRRIRAFGVYDPLPGEPTFQAGLRGQPGERVCVYAEVRNARSQCSGSWHVVALDGTLEILDHDGRLVFRSDFPATPDRSRSPRTDCYVGYEFNVPAGVPAGGYVLRLTVRDAAGRQARGERKFRVVEPVAAAAGW